MRPQHITAENAAQCAREPKRRSGFNEAAAYHCGKPDLRQHGYVLRNRLQ